MTDNVTANAGSGGATFATDDDGTAHHPYVKLEFGADNTQTKVSTTNPLPVTLANTGANTTAVKVDGSAVTQPVSAASLPLPSGAATAAKQPALGTAGTASADVLTVQGIASMTALKVDGSAVTQPVSGTVTANAGTGTFTVSGTVTANAGSGPFPVSDNSGSLTVDAPVGTPVFVRLSDGAAAITALPVTDNSGSLTVDNAGTFAVQAAQSGTWTVQPGNTANTTAWLVSERPGASGGLSMSKTVSAASTNATSVKASAGQIYSIQCFNLNAAARYLKLYNKASAPTVGTDTPVKTLLIPGNTAGAGFIFDTHGLEFTTGIAFALTTGIADSDTAAVAANEIVVNIDYK
jgi:hypothetical protein